MARVTAAELRQEIGRLLDLDPDLSQAEVVRRIRGGGVQARDQRIRANLRTERAIRGAADRAVRSTVAGFEAIVEAAGRGSRTVRSDSALSATLDTGRGLRGLGLRTQLLESGATQGRGGAQATHARIDYECVYEAEIFYYGNPSGITSGRVAGRIVQDLRLYQRDLIEVRIEQQVVGQINQKFNPSAESVQEGLEINFTMFDVRITSVELRG